MSITIDTAWHPLAAGCPPQWANAPALDEIAWYGGNSGVDFEWDNGRATSGE